MLVHILSGLSRRFSEKIIPHPFLIRRIRVGDVFAKNNHWWLWFQPSIFLPLLVSRRSLRGWKPVCCLCRHIFKYSRILGLFFHMIEGDSFVFFWSAPSFHYLPIMSGEFCQLLFNFIDQPILGMSPNQYPFNCEFLFISFSWILCISNCIFDTEV